MVTLQEASANSPPTTISRPKMALPQPQWETLPDRPSSRGSSNTSFAVIKTSSNSRSETRILREPNEVVEKEMLSYEEKNTKPQVKAEPVEDVHGVSKHCSSSSSRPLANVPPIAPPACPTSTTTAIASTSNNIIPASSAWPKLNTWAVASEHTAKDSATFVLDIEEVAQDAQDSSFDSIRIDETSPDASMELPTVHTSGQPRWWRVRPEYTGLDVIDVIGPLFLEVINLCNKFTGGRLVPELYVQEKGYDGLQSFGAVLQIRLSHSLSQAHAVPPLHTRLRDAIEAAASLALRPSDALRQSLPDFLQAHGKRIKQILRRDNDVGTLQAFRARYPQLDVRVAIAKQEVVGRVMHVAAECEVDLHFIPVKISKDTFGYLLVARLSAHLPFSWFVEPIFSNEQDAQIAVCFKAVHLGNFEKLVRSNASVPLPLLRDLRSTSEVKPVPFFKFQLREYGPYDYNYEIGSGDRFQASNPSR